MPSRRFDIDFVVFTTTDARAPAPDEILEVCQDRVEFRRIVRTLDRAAFEPPACVPDPKGTLWTPMSEACRRKLCDAIAMTSIGWRIGSHSEAEDLTPLQLAVGVAASALQSQGGVAVIDRISGVGYSAETFLEQADELSETGDITFCDMVRLVEKVEADGLSIRTMGMTKFGHRELVIEGLPPRYRDFGVWLLAQALGKYPALHAVLGPGQNFAYTRANPNAKLFFLERPDGTLLVTDCDATEKKPVQGLRTCISTLYPTFLLQQHQMVSADDDDDDDGRAHINTFDEYVDFTRLIHNGQTVQAFRKYGVNWGSLGPVTYQWTHRIFEASLVNQFERRMWR